MYEELVNRLRYCSEEQSGCGLCALSSDCVLRVGLLTQAADAIEELSRAQEQWIEQERKALLKSIPHWIPVTEWLPKEWKSVLTYQPYKNDREKPLIRVSWYIGAGIWRECERANTLELPVTYWMPLPEPPKEEA